MKLVARIALVSGAMGLLASCTTAKVYSVVPEAKPSAADVAMLNTLQTADTSGATTTETAAIKFTPVDLASDKTTAMAYAIPVTRPDMNPVVASVETAAADQAALATMPNPAATTTISTTTALVEEQPKTRSLEPFVTSAKNTDLNQLITKYAALYDVPEPLVHHVVRRESNYNPAAVHRGNWGLMQIRYNTARGLGYDGTANGLLDAETNLKYAVKYLRGAWIVADKDPKKADWLYRTGYYYEAKRKKLLDVLEMR